MPNAVSRSVESNSRAGWEPMLTYTVAWAYMLKGNIVEGERIAQETLEKAQKNNAVGPQAWVFLVQTLLAIQSAQWQRAQEWSDRRIDARTPDTRSRSAGTCPVGP